MTIEISLRSVRTWIGGVTFGLAITDSIRLLTSKSEPDNHFLPVQELIHYLSKDQRGRSWPLS